MKAALKRLLPLFDVGMLPFVYPSGLVLRLVRRGGVNRLPLCKRALNQVGVFPIRNHYYEPLFDPAQLNKPLDKDRNLPGLDLNTQEQLALLEQYNFGGELYGLTHEKFDDDTFHFSNKYFESGDAEYWYNLIRHIKPKRIIEIGSGYSTLIAHRAIEGNKQELFTYTCEHICIEPYEQPWLEKLGVEVIRERVETLGVDRCKGLEENDILFIDSSHVIRPQGDVLFEYLELLPSLKKGVIVHIHDIFTPRDYLKQWVVDEVRFWNEQYLLEAFLSGSKDWKVIGALNYLHHNHYERLKEKCPYLTPEREPASFYIQKTA
jgi:hypothetical protein